MYSIYVYRNISLGNCSIKERNEEKALFLYFPLDLPPFTELSRWQQWLEKMIMVYNQELFWCNGVPTKHGKALKCIQSPRGHILPTNKLADLADSLPMAVSHLHVSFAHSSVGLLLT